MYRDIHACEDRETTSIQHYVGSHVEMRLPKPMTSFFKFKLLKSLSSENWNVDFPLTHLMYWLALPLCLGNMGNISSVAV